MSAPGPGWYVDPQSEDHLSWWNGENWTEQKQDRHDFSTAETPPVTREQYVPMASPHLAMSREIVLALTRSRRDREIRRNNSFAHTGCFLALVRFLFNPFAILSILGIIFSAIGLAKAHELEGRQWVTGRGTAIAGLIIGLVGLALVAWMVSTKLA